MQWKAVLRELEVQSDWLPGDSSESTVLRGRAYEKIYQILTPEENLVHEMKTSPIARALRESLTEISLTEEQFTSAYRLLKAQTGPEFDRGSLSPEKVHAIVFGEKRL